MSKSGKINSDKTSNDHQEPKSGDAQNTGNYLRTLRIGKGLSIKDVAEATRISASNLNAIEDQNFSALPAPTFTRGLVNIYAQFLGADAESIVVRFMEEGGRGSGSKRRPKPRQPGRILAPKRLAEPAQISSMSMAGILFLIIVATFTGYCVYTSWNPFSFLVQESTDIQSAMKNVITGEKPVPAPSQSEEIIIVQPEQKEEATTNTLAGQAEEQGMKTETETIPPDVQEEVIPDQTGVMPEHPYTVSLMILQDTSVEVSKDGDEPVTIEFSAGDTPFWSADDSLTLSFSQPESAEILVNNTPVAFPNPGDDGKYTLQVPEVLPQADE